MDSKIEKAGLHLRIIAFLIDHFIIVAIAFIPFFLSFNKVIDDTESIFSFALKIVLIAFLLYLIKDSILGISIGKWFMGIKVREKEDYHKVPGVFRLLVRNIFTFLWLIELIVLVASKDQRKLGDKLAKTEVVKETKNRNMTVRIILIILIAILFITIFITSIIFGTINIVKSSDGYHKAIDYIEGNQMIQQETGEILDYGRFPLGGISIENGYGNANFDIKVIGKKETVIVHISLTKNPGEEWKIVNVNY